MRNKEEIIYSLNIQDIQDVALDGFERELTGEELEIVIESINKRVNWYDAIFDSIMEITH